MKRDFLFLSLPDDLPEHSGLPKHSYKAASKPSHPPPETSWFPGLQDNGSDNTWKTHNINGMQFVSGFTSYLCQVFLSGFLHWLTSRPLKSKLSHSCITSALSYLPSRSECTVTPSQLSMHGRSGHRHCKALTNTPAALTSTEGMGNQGMISFTVSMFSCCGM